MAAVEHSGSAPVPAERSPTKDNRTMKTFSAKPADISGLATYIRDGAVYTKDNPGSPVSYTVRFLKDNKLAIMGFTTEYTLTDSTIFPNGWIQVDNESHGFSTKFTVTWSYSLDGVEIKSDDNTTPYLAADRSRTFDVPGDAYDVWVRAHVQGTDIHPINKHFQGAPNTCIYTYGATIGDVHWTTKPLPDAQNPNRNPHLSRADVERYLLDYGVGRHVIWLGEGIVGDDTDGHVDDLTRFVAADTVVTVLEDDPQDENYALLQENYERLLTMKDQDGQPLRVIKLPITPSLPRTWRVPMRA